MALAILMPIVASMGGNAGTQTLTVAVRALATREPHGVEHGPLHRPRGAGRADQRGRVRGADRGAEARFYFANVTLGVVIGVAMVGNMVVAAFAGVLAPDRPRPG